MKQVLSKRAGVAVEEIPAPLVSEGTLLIEVDYSFISIGTEMSVVSDAGESLIRKAMNQPAKVKMVLDKVKVHGISKTYAMVKGKMEIGTALGYSCAGRVIEAGPGVEGFRPGDRVACAGAGLASHAEVVCVPRNLVVPAPDACSMKDAASVTIGAIAMQGVRQCEVRLGEYVAVVGLGLIGQIAVQLLAASGARVIAIDIDPARIKLALECGAFAGVNSRDEDQKRAVAQLTGNRGADIVLIAAASKSDEIIQASMEMARKKGRVVILGAVGLGMKRSPWYEKEVDLKISCSYGPGRYDSEYEEQGRDYPYAYVRWTENRNMEEYLRLVSEGKVVLDRIISKEYPIEEAEKAYAELAESTDKPLGVVLRFNAEKAIALKTIRTVQVSSPASAAGKKPIRVAIIGAGAFAKEVHLPNLQTLGDAFQVHTVMSRTGVSAVNLARQFNVPHTSTDYAEVLRNPEIDLVFITTRHNQHASQVKAALQAGKHVFVEKPLCLTEAELEDILSVYRGLGDRKPLLMVGFNRRFSPAVQAIRKGVAARKEPLQAVYRVNAGYLPPTHWVHTAEGGGRIAGEGCHMFDVFDFLVGAEVESVDTSSLRPSPGYYSPRDNVAATVKYADGSVCTLIYTALGDRGLDKEYLEVHCGQVSYVLNDFKELAVHGGRGAWKGAATDKGHLEELKAIKRWFDEGGVMPVPAESMERTTRLSIMVEKSA